MSIAIVTDESPVPSARATSVEPPLERILVATRGECDCDAALALAARIAARERAALEAVTVFPPLVPLPPLARTEERRRFRGERRDRTAAALLLRRARHHWRDVLGGRPAAHHFLAGVPSHAIAACAHTTGADLVVLGIGRADLDARALGSLTSTQLAVLSDVPVLAVAPHLGELPGHAVVHAESPRVARAMLAAAARVLALGAAVTVVRPRWSEPHELPGWSALDDWWTLQRGRSAIPLRWRDPETAADIDAELVVVPVPGGTSAVRSLMSGRVVRAFQRARSSVLAVPVDVLRPARAARRFDD